MIQIQTKLKINDNSGVKIGQCIKIYKKKNRKNWRYNFNFCKKITFKSKKKIKIVKGALFKALIIHTTYQKKNTIGNFIKFDKNSLIILNNQNKPLGTRIFGPITSEFRKQKNFKILSLAAHIL